MTGIAPAAAYGLGLLSALLLFASILLTSSGSSARAATGSRSRRSTSGCSAAWRGWAGYPKTAASHELRFALAGPLVTLAIAAAFGALDAALPSSAPAALRAVVEYQAFVNLAILVFNLLPAFPLDGGRVARALIWGRIGDITRATRSPPRSGVASATA